MATFIADQIELPQRAKPVEEGVKVAPDIEVIRFAAMHIIYAHVLRMEAIAPSYAQWMATVYGVQLLNPPNSRVEDIASCAATAIVKEHLRAWKP